MRLSAQQQRTQQEFRDTAQAHLDALYRTALRILRDHYEAEDAVQESLQKGWRKLDQFDQGTQMKSWLFKILTNTCLDVLRAKGRLKRQLGTEGVDPNEIESPQRLPEQVLSDKRLGESIDAAVNRLPIEQQIVVQMIAVEQLSYAQAAQALDLPIGTIRSRLSRARASISEALSRSESGADSNRLRLVR